MGGRAEAHPRRGVHLCLRVAGNDRMFRSDAARLRMAELGFTSTEAATVPRRHIYWRGGREGLLAASAIRSTPS
jgi:hypothetical protein